MSIVQSRCHDCGAWSYAGYRNCDCAEPEIAPVAWPAPTQDQIADDPKRGQAKFLNQGGR